MMSKKTHGEAVSINKGNTTRAQTWFLLPEGQTCFSKFSGRSTIRILGIALITVAIVFGCSDGNNDNPGGGHIHQWGEYTVTTPATCIATGIKIRVCTLDATHTETETIPIDPNAHVWGDLIEGTAPTCTEAGIGLRTCTLNNLHTDNGIIAALGHDYGNWTETTAPTCTEAGEETGTCSHDSTHTETRPVAALGHDWEWVTTATFISAGVSTGTCKHDSSHIEIINVGPLPITTGEEWTTALSQLNGKTGEYTLNILGNIGVSGGNFGTTASGSSLTVTLNGEGKLYLTSQGYIIHIGANQTLIIDSEDLTLEGLTNGKNGATEDNNNPMVYVMTGGTLELKNGIISGNTTSSVGGGVFVYDNGTFTMSGGEIYGNTADTGGGVMVFYGTFTMNGGKISGNAADTGGGVYVGYYATFIMHGGEIYGNTASSFGAGVYVGGTTTFTMNGGEISGNTASSSGGGVYVEGTNATFRIVTGTIYGSNASPASLRNTATTSGAALDVRSGTAQRGTFSGENGAWVSKADLTTTNDTINVLDGDIVQ